MGLEKIGWLIDGLATALSGVKGLGPVFFAIGFIILMLIGVTFALAFLIRVIKELPNMTVGQFLKALIIMSFALMFLGIIL